MIITKRYKFEAAHVVWDSFSKRCAENIHGHSYRVEVSFSADRLDSNGMVIDFGRLKRLSEFIDSFDHSFILYSKDKPQFKEFILGSNSRVVTLPIKATAEGLALTFALAASKIIDQVDLYSVTVHETASGSATAFSKDLSLCNFALEDIEIMSK